LSERNVLPMTIRVLRVYHGGRDPQHRGRDRALVAAGVDLTLVVPSAWPDASAEARLSPEPFRVIQLPVRRGGDVNRHVHTDVAAVESLLAEMQPDVLDIHEEPMSLAARLWLRAAQRDLPTVMYTAQNIDKRFPPPFAGYERRALGRADALYPCSLQAASVARGKGFAGIVEVLPLGYDDSLYASGTQAADDTEIVLGFAGRLVPEKGLLAAVDVLEAVGRSRAARLLVVGDGPEADACRRRAADLGVGDRLELLPWTSSSELASAYRRMHVLLVPSIATASWAEQFGRVVVEAQASGVVVAAYASGALPEVVGDSGLLAAEGDVVALAGAVIELLADPERYERRRAAGLERAAQRTWARVAERQAALYERARSGPVARRDTGRTAARAEFGATARTPAGDRPFALPRVLRSLVSR
jgi:glycosyltransferase involved in cell wall biosynthesis